MTTEEIKEIVKEMKADEELSVFFKRYLRLNEATVRYPVSLKKLRDVAHDGNAVLKINQLVLIDTVAFEKYLETFRVFVIYPVNRIQEDLCISKGKALDCLQELENIGLIDRKHYGQGKPSYIYVKSFVREGAQEFRNQTSRSLYFKP